MLQRCMFLAGTGEGVVNVTMSKCSCILPVISEVYGRETLNLQN